MQFIWRPFSKHYDSSNEIYTHAFLNRYVWPEGFNLDRNKGRDSKISASNAKKRANDFMNYIKSKV